MSDTNDAFDGLGLVDLLDLLEPVPVPEPVSWQPQTAGWLWLGAAVLAAVIWGGRRYLQHRKANAYRKAGLRALAKAGDDPAAISDVLKRTALAGFPRENVASLSGSDWLEFLDRTLQSQQFSTGHGAKMATAAYQPHSPEPGLNALAATWIRKHKRPKQTPTPPQATPEEVDA